MRVAVKIMLLTMVALFAMAAPASAHGATSSTASNFHSVLTSVQPPLSNVAIQVKENGDRLQLKNTSDAVVIVLGYQSEPYLRILKNGVYENRFSPAVYANANRYGNAEPPSFADARKQPEWHKISNGNVAVWHDHRAHWMSTSPPPVVQSNRHISHVVIPHFTIQLLIDNKPAVIDGQVIWSPPIPKWKWGSVAFLAAIVIACVAKLKNKTAAITVGITAVIASDVSHVVGTFVGGAGRLQTRLGNAATSDFTSVLAWCTGVWVLVAVYKKQKEVVAYVALFTAAILCLFGGITDLRVMWDSQVVSSFPKPVARAAVAITAGAGLATLVTSMSLLQWGAAGTRRAEAANDNHGAATDHQ